MLWWHAVCQSFVLHARFWMSCSRSVHLNLAQHEKVQSEKDMEHLIWILVSNRQERVLQVTWARCVGTWCVPRKCMQIRHDTMWVIVGQKQSTNSIACNMSTVCVQPSWCGPINLFICNGCGAMVEPFKHLDMQWLWRHGERCAEPEYYSMVEMMKRGLLSSTIDGKHSRRKHSLLSSLLFGFVVIHRNSFNVEYMQQYVWFAIQ